MWHSQFQPMNASAAATGSKFYNATIGKKVVMAVTGLVLAGFVVVHMAGNLGIVGGAEKFNHYAALLRTSMPLLWAARVVLIASVVLHIRAAVQLYALKAAARPVQYAKKAYRGATPASRFMIWSGYALARVHRLPHPPLHDGHGAPRTSSRVTSIHNVTIALPEPADRRRLRREHGFLFMHLSHGLFSFTQSLGAQPPALRAARASHRYAVAGIVSAGFAAVPIAVIAAVVR